MFVARPEEQNITEADNMPSDVTIVPMGLNIPGTVAPGEEVNTAVVNMDCNAPITTMTTGLRCTIGACVYNTDSQVPKDTDFPIKVQLLQIHAVSVHNVGTVGQDYAQHGVEFNAEVVHVDSDASTMTKQKDEVNNSFVDAATDITATTIAELECPYANCQYVTGAGQDCVQYGMEMYAAAYMQRDLKMHIAGKHTEYVDAARTTTSKGRNKSSGRSHGSKKRDKFRRSVLEYDEGDELC